MPGLAHFPIQLTRHVHTRRGADHRLARESGFGTDCYLRSYKLCETQEWSQKCTGGQQNRKTGSTRDRAVCHPSKWLLNQLLILKTGNYGTELNLSCVFISVKPKHPDGLFRRKNLDTCIMPKQTPCKPFGHKG